MKGGDFCQVVIGDGAVEFFWRGHPRSLNKRAVYLEWKHEELWSPSQLKLIREYPEILIGKLASVGWRYRSGRHFLSFPIGGLLWLWLAAGFYGEAKLLRHPAVLPEGAPVVIVGSRKRVAMLGGAMLALIAIFAVADRVARGAEDANTCAEQILMLQRHLKIRLEGEYIPWECLFDRANGVGPRYRTCPTGVAYPLSHEMPSAGTPAVQCPCEDHRRYFAGNYGEK